METKWNARKRRALVAIDPKTGTNFNNGGLQRLFDKTLMAISTSPPLPDNPGSSFKPFIYATAFNEAYPGHSALWPANGIPNGPATLMARPSRGHNQSRLLYAPRFWRENPRTNKFAQCTGANPSIFQRLKLFLFNRTTKLPKHRGRVWGLALLGQRDNMASL